ncbi:E2 [Rhinella marina papillomavirus 1]|nr:E2 [Rhinella marina papillomavirus 1]
MNMTAEIAKLQEKAINLQEQIFIEKIFNYKDLIEYFTTEVTLLEKISEFGPSSRPKRLFVSGVYVAIPSVIQVRADLQKTSAVLHALHLFGESYKRETRRLNISLFNFNGIFNLDPQRSIKGITKEGRYGFYYEYLYLLSDNDCIRVQGGRDKFGTFFKDPYNEKTYYGQIREETERSQEASSSTSSAHNISDSTNPSYNTIPPSHLSLGHESFNRSRLERLEAEARDPPGLLLVGKTYDVQSAKHHANKSSGVIGVSTMFYFEKQNLVSTQQSCLILFETEKAVKDFKKVVNKIKFVDCKFDSKPPNL